MTPATDATLSKILAEQMADAPELPRLPVADTFMTFNRMGAALDNAREAFKRIPESNRRETTDEHLKDIIKFCNAAIKAAERLLEANR